MGKLFDRIRQTIANLTNRTLPHTPVDPGVPGDVVQELNQPVEIPDWLDQASITHVLRKAASSSCLVYLQYNQQFRYVEGYSFRVGKHGLLYYGYCLSHETIHSFYIHRIQSVKLTSIPFVPRWTVEL